MHAFLGGVQEPESWLVVAAMLDFQYLSWGKEAGRSPSLSLSSFSFQPNTHPIGHTFSSPQSSSGFNIQDGGYST